MATPPLDAYPKDGRAPDEAETRLLIVDDEESILLAMGEYFRSRGFQTDCAREREEAEALLARRPYEVVIADLRLSWLEMTAGLDLVSLVRQRYPRTRCILLTAHGSAELEQEAMLRGADRFLRKPQPLDRIALIVQELLLQSGTADPQQRSGLSPLDETSRSEV